MAGQLVVQVGDLVVQTLALGKPTLTIGRTPDNDLTLSSIQVSRRHAEIRLENEEVVLTDLGSANGTFVEGVKLLPQQPHLLASGEAFDVGPYRVTYQARETQGRSEARDTKESAKAPLSGLETTKPPNDIASDATPLPIAVESATMTWPVGIIDRTTTSKYLQHLPIIFHDNDFLRRFLMIFETLWEPLEERQDHIDMYFDPRTCPACFLPWLASWLDLTVKVHWPERRLRSLMAEATELYRWRGTKYGLTRMIEVCTGLTPEISETKAPPFVFLIRVRFPLNGSVDREVVEELIRMHKPAHVGYVLE